MTEMDDNSDCFTHSSCLLSSSFRSVRLLDPVSSKSHFAPLPPLYSIGVEEFIELHSSLKWNAKQKLLRTVKRRSGQTTSKSGLTFCSAHQNGKKVAQRVIHGQSGLK